MCWRTALVADATFVDVVTEPENQVKLRFGCQGLVGRVVTRLPVLTGPGCDDQPIHGRFRRWRGAGDADGAGVVPGPEAVVEAGVRREPVGDGVDTVVGIGGGRCGPGGDERIEGVVRGDLPDDLGVVDGHRTADNLRVRRQPGPQHDRSRVGIAGGNAQRERVAGQAVDRWCVDRVDRPSAAGLGIARRLVVGGASGQSGHGDSGRAGGERPEDETTVRFSAHGPILAVDRSGERHYGRVRRRRR